MKVIHVATPDQMAAFLWLAGQMHAESNFSELQFDGQTYANRLAYFMSSPDYMAILAQDADGNYVGAAAACVTRCDFGPDLLSHDRGIYVHPTRRGASAAKALVAEYVRWATELGVKRISIDVRAGVNPDRAEKFFQHMGFETVGPAMVYRG